MELGQIYDSVMPVQGARGESQPICEKGKCHVALGWPSEACSIREPGGRGSQQTGGGRARCLGALT